MNELSIMERFVDPVLFEQLSKGELVQGALITTMMGMGITFVVLTLLWGVIAAVTKVINGTEKKNSGSTPLAAPAAVPAAAVQNTAPAAPATAEIGAEIIAVITAAIAAMENQSSTSNQLIIRKISRVSGNSTSWSRAGAADCIESRKI
jgi:sodium pump decarboxylase gamma subunit